MALMMKTLKCWENRFFFLSPTPMCARACSCYVNVTCVRPSSLWLYCTQWVHVCLMYEKWVNVCVALRRLLLPLSDVVPHTAVQFTVRAVVFLRASPCLCRHCCSPVWNPDTGAQKPPEPGSVGRYPMTPMTPPRTSHHPLVLHWQTATTSPDPPSLQLPKQPRLQL